MTKQVELITKITSLAEERMKYLLMDQSRQDVDWEFISKRINDIPLEIEELKKELYETKNEEDRTSYLNMLTQEELAKKIGTTKQHISVLREVGVLQATKTGKGYMFSQEEIQRFERVYKGYDVSNKVKALESYREVNNGV